MGCVTYNTYDQGDLVRVRANKFTDADGVAIDPATVKVSVKTPAGTVTTLVYGTDAAVVRTATGQYELGVDANASGFWHYRWFSTGTGQAAGEKRFYVRAAEAI